MKKIISFLFLLAVAAFTFYSGVELDFDGITSAAVVENVIGDQGSIELYFCPREDCEGALVRFIDSATTSVHCALFDIGLESVQNKLLEKSAVMDVKIVTDNDYIKKFNHPFVKEDKWGLMHNKFCIIDGKKVSSGSMNPTNNGAHKNNNNLLLIESSVIASNYEAEFQEMWNGTFKKGNRVNSPVVDVNGITVKTYFCPDDNCAMRIKEELNKATKSIHFMTFSFTHEGIANVLLLKDAEGVDVRGVMEARQVTKYSKFSVLENYIDVVKDSNKQNMHHKVYEGTPYAECPKLGQLHHKVFIIDGETVITGSMNPSANGDSRNDENVLIIHNEEIAQRFLDEFDCIYARNT